MVSGNAWKARVSVCAGATVANQQPASKIILTVRLVSKLLVVQLQCDVILAENCAFGLIERDE